MDIQEIIVLVLVTLAAVYMGRHLWKSATTRDGDACSGCGGCGKPRPNVEGVRAAPQATPLVTLSTPPQRHVKPRV